MIGIYKITSPSNRIYIGQAVNICIRFSTYRKLKCKMQPRLYSSFKKYGVDNHVFQVIDICDTDQLNDRERYWQDFYNVLSKTGLNCILTATNEKKKVISQEVKDKIRLKTKMYKHTPEAVEKIRKSSTGRVFSEETKKKISESQIGKMVSKNTCDKISKALKGRKIPKEVLAKRSISISGGKNWRAKTIIDLETGIFYECITEAAEAKCIKKSTLNNYLIGNRPNKTCLIYAK
jgi:group I intron endonuclease